MSTALTLDAEPLRLEAGIWFGVPDEDYHADPAPEPSLSASFAKAMLESTPNRAREKHPRLNPACEPFEQTAAMAEGSALHAMILGVGAAIKVIKFDDWRKKDAKEAKKQAIAEGMTPVLAHKYEDLCRIAKTTRELLQDDPENRQILSDDYESEVTMIWQERNGIYCRARADRMHRSDGAAPIYDFKFTDRQESPADWDRGVIDSFWDMRAAFYARGASMLRDGEEPPYRYVIIEKDAPSESIVFELSESFLKLGHAKAATAIDGYGRCMKAGLWPRYPRRTLAVSEPGWAERSWLEKQSFFGFVLPPLPQIGPPQREPLLDYINRDPDPFGGG